MSVELQKLRGELLREALLKGWTRPSDVPTPWTYQLEQARLERWYKRLYQAPDRPMPVGQRLINHFMLGADPEFVFHTGTDRVDARVLDLKAGPAFGADNNGRLCELRPAPSRSALSVLASIWLAMRWMAVFHPNVLGHNWRSGCYFAGDGLGGHVHFGRKRTKLREREIAVLDRLTHLEFVAGIFDREEGRMRVRQSQGAPQGHYGELGDIRRQPHGWEYRTLPSWIDTPWLAYFNLVASKLVVALPDLVAPLSEADAALTNEQARGQLRMLLAYYSPLDDDARLASAILARKGFPQHAHGLDFKVNWGLFASGPFGNKRETEPPKILPEVVPPTAEEEQELALSMFEGRPPELTPLRPTWSPSTLPEGYVHAICATDTKVAPGLGEFAMGLCMHKDCLYTLLNMGHSGMAFRFPHSLTKVVDRSGLLKKLEVPADCAVENAQIHINATKDFTLEQLLLARKHIVESQVFPIWDISTVQPDSYKIWLAGRKSKAPKGSKLEFEGDYEKRDANPEGTGPFDL